MAVPYTFATATSSIPLSQLDSNFATGITLGNTTVYLGNTTTSFGNVTLTNVTISNVATTFPNSFLSYSSVTLGTTNVSLGGTATTLANVSLSNVTISSVASAITVSEGGTGLTTLTTGYIPYGNGTSAFSSSANLTFNGTLLNVTGNINSTNSCTLARTDGQLLVVGDQTSGGAKLDVQTASGTASNLRLYQQGVSNFTISVPASTDALTFSSYAGERMRISSAGYLGIGTSSPANTLHVLSSVGTNTYFQSSATAVYLKFGNSLATDGFIGYESTGGNQMTFYTANTEKMRLDSSGNLGLGVTPSAWGVGSGGHAFELAGGNSIWSYSSSSGFNFSQNLYYNGAYYYKTTNGASSYGQYNGVHYWYNAPSGAAGTTFALTQAMTLDNSGNLGIGTTSPTGRVHSSNSYSNSSNVSFVAEANIPGYNLRSSGGGRLSLVTGYIGANISSILTATSTNNPSDEMMRFDHSNLFTSFLAGNVGIGTSSPNASAILDAQSTTKGVRMPNMTTTQKNAISSPAAGLMVFDTTLAKLCVYSGSAWQTITSI